MKIVRFLRIELLAENVAIVMIGTSTSNGRNIALKIRNDRNVALEMAEFKRKRGWNEELFTRI